MEISVKKDNINNYFVEIIIIILFFAIASTIILRIFASSVSNNDYNEIYSKTIINSTSIIDTYKSGLSLEDSLKMVIGDKYSYKEQKGYTIIKLDKNMKYKIDGNVELKIKETKKLLKSGVCKTINIRYIYRNKEIYVIEGKKYEEK